MLMDLSLIRVHVHVLTCISDPWPKTVYGLQMALNRIR